MLRTKLCDLFGIQQPVINAPMTGTATADLAAAVSGAGGLGLIGAGMQPNNVWLREQIQRVRQLTDRPFGVGFISSAPGVEESIGLAIDEKVSAISLSFSDPTPYVGAAHAAGVKVLAQVQTVAQAQIAAAASVDIIAAQGTEAGGHTGFSGTLALVLAVIDSAGDIPVVASGGIADGRGLAAVLMLGAAGAWVGTRFVASAEWAGDGWVRDKVVEASADDTVMTKAYDLVAESPFPATTGHRVLRNNFTDAWAGRIHEIPSHRSELQGQIADATKAADTSVASVNAGVAAGLISRVEPAGDIVRRITAEAEALLRERPLALVVG